MLEKETQQLFQTLVRNDSIPIIVEILQKDIFQNPVMVTNTHFSVLAMASNIIFSDEIWDYASLHHCCSRESILSFRNDKASKVLFEQDQSFIYNTNLGKEIPRILGRITHNGEVHGYLIVFEVNRSFDSLDIQRSNLACQSLGVTLSNTQEPETQKEHLYRKVLEIKEDNLLEIENDILQSPWNFKSNFKIISLKHQSEHALHYAGYLCNELNKYSSDLTAFIYKSEILVVSNFDDEILHRNTLGYIEHLCQQYSYVYGMSMTFYDLIRLPTYSQQARRSREIGMLIHNNRIVFPYSRYQFFDLISHLSIQELESMLCKEYYALVHYDKSHNSELIHTCIAYFLNNCNMNQTAKKLHIHRNTLAYRLNMIKTVMHHSFDDIEILILIYHSCMIDQWIQIIK